MNTAIQWEPNAYQVQRALVNKDDPLIFDVGAYNGDTSAEYWKVFPGLTAHLFEPNPLAYDVLVATKLLAGTEWAHLWNFGLADTNGKATLFETANPQCNSILTPEVGAESFWLAPIFEVKGTREIEVVMLDSFCREHGISHIDVLKVDVQGAEGRVFTGAGAMLGAKAIDLIYCEVLFAPAYREQSTFTDILRQLGGYGYYLHSLLNLYLDANYRMYQADAIWLPERA